LVGSFIIWYFHNDRASQKKKKEKILLFLRYSKSYQINNHLVFLLDMLAHSPKDRSRSPHRTNGTTTNQTTSSSSKHSTSSQNETNTTNNKTKKDNESQLRMKSLKVSLNKKEKTYRKINMTFCVSLVIYSNINK
jgi:hypothetical protein